MLLGSAALATPAAAAPAGPGAPSAPTAYQETYRPQVHFTPKRNWMNDPNGLVFYKGTYHLFFQYNPEGDRWGNMSWGHATSPDLVHWTEQPVAIPKEGDEAIFSGSVVVDEANTSGLGTAKNPPLVAVYTSSSESTGHQAQSLAYSVDAGKTWTKYAANPVLDIDSTSFRDPKVFWYAPTKSWRMVVAHADARQIGVYSSPDLTTWTHLSDFGPRNAVGGAWECPDLFPLPVDGDRKRTKWVMIVSLNPGGVAGGSGTQYFVGDFDGTSFTPDGPASYTPPAGTDWQDFESGYGDWTPSGSAFGSTSYPGTVPGQQQVTGYSGERLVNSFLGGDASTGTLRSPEFTVSTPYLNFLVGGGRHPYVPGSITEPPTGTVFADFEGDTWGEGWVGTGDLATAGPTAESLPGQVGAKVADTCVGPCDPATGTLTSPEFTIGSDFVNLLVAGGKHPWGEDRPTAVNLLVGGQVVATATGDDSGNMRWVGWEVADRKGQTARIQIVDEGTGDRGWDHLMVDQIMFSNTKATAWDQQTAVNLVVDGTVVQSVTGQDSESLDWAAFDLRGLQGKTAHVEIVDRNTGGWGHVLADRFQFASAPALTTLQRSQWLDFGADAYAGVTFSNAPGGKRLLVAWMNNWNYAQDIPTSPWRSAMTLPRELTLATVGGKVQLVSTPVRQLAKQRAKPTVDPRRTLRPGKEVTLKAKGGTLEIDAAIAVGTASDVGLAVRTGNGQATRIGYDATTGEVYVDRTASGDVAFHPLFSGVHRAPLALQKGVLRLRIVVDASSVEVFAGSSRTPVGAVVLTDQIFPDPSSTGVSAYAEGGTATLLQSKAWTLRSAWR